MKAAQQNSPKLIFSGRITPRIVPPSSWTGTRRTSLSTRSRECRGHRQTFHSVRQITTIRDQSFDLPTNLDEHRSIKLQQYRYSGRHLVPRRRHHPLNPQRWCAVEQLHATLERNQHVKSSATLYFGCSTRSKPFGAAQGSTDLYVKAVACPYMHVPRISVHCIYSVETSDTAF